MGVEACGRSDFRVVRPITTFVSMDIRERLQTIMRVNNMNATSFAEKIGVQRSGVSHILNGRNKPSLDFIQRVLEHFPRVDAGWLITGKAPGSSQKASAEQTAAPLNQPEPKDESQSAELPPLFPSSPKNKKPIERIIVFYEDRSFDEYVKTGD